MIDRARPPRPLPFVLFACLVGVVAGSITPATPADSIVATGSMPEFREHHRAVRLADGRVLVVGGSFFSVSGAFLYDPATGAFTTVGAMTTAPGRTQHTLTLLSSGNVLVAGGWNPAGGSPLSSAQLYNPTTATFTATGSLAGARSDHTATVLPSGQILIAAGQVGIGTALATTELYTPGTGLFSGTGSLATARYGHVAAALPGGRVLVAGGYGPGSAILSTAEVYNPATGAWSATGSLGTGRTGAAATSLADGRVLVVSGRGTAGILASAEIYNPVTGTFSSVPMLAGRLSSSATLLQDNRVLVAGGGDASGAVPVLANPSTELFNPVSGAFAAGPAMIEPRMFLTATLLNDGRVLLTGGEKANQILRTAELFLSGCEDEDGDGVNTCQGDCDDSDPARFPGNTEICDSLDNDCDVAVDEDGDSDGFPACNDCNNANPAMFPGNPETCDGLDNDCDNAVDEDGDGDGITVCGDCDDANPARFPGNPEVCDGIDNDCAGGPPVQEADADGDGYRICGGDCNDASPAVFPGAGCVIPVRLNEILYSVDPASADPLARQEWVELFNAGPVAVDLTGWVLSNRSGATGPGARALPPALLPAGAYLVVHVGPGVNDLDFSDHCGAVYTNDAASFDLFDDVMDEAALYAPFGIQDFIGWRYGSTGYVPGTAHANAVAAGIWTAGTFLNTEQLAHSPIEKFRTVRPGTAIGRDKDSTDTDRPSDWDAHGGRHAAGLTPCRRNQTRLPLVPGDPPPGTACDGSFREWTIMVYISGDNNLEAAALDDLEEMETAGGTDGNVNVVVMVDGTDMITQASFGPGGELIFDPTTNGGTFRFCVGPQQDPRPNPDYVLMINRDGSNPYLGERNLADPAELAGFITWTKQRFHSSKYALIVWGHGAGWKGVAFDESAAVGGKDDALFMGELSQALAGHSFELLGFDSCLMGMIEVAHQVQPFSRYMVASQETEPGDGWPYDLWIPALKASPTMDGRALGDLIVKQYDAATPAANRTLSCVDQSRLLELSTAVSNFSSDLRGGLDDFLTHTNREDNVERRVELDREATESFEYMDYMDLHHFTDLIRQDPIIPVNPFQCYKARLKPAFDLSVRNGPVIVTERHGPAHPNANGLSIYMPKVRTPGAVPLDSDPYDYPSFSRITTASTQRAMYAPNNDCLPFLGRDIETGAALATPPQWPLVPTPNFQFRLATAWDEFLLRYYHPVADNRILFGICPDGIHFPVVIDPICGNPVDELFLPPMVCTVFFTGLGSSDADTASRQPHHWMWDFDAAVDGCPGCLAPYEVPAGADASTAGQDMDAERTCSKAPLNDEKDVDASEPSHDYCHPGRYDYVVTLNAWDDNHEFDLHDTLPSALYVHPQTDSHISKIHCNSSFQAPPPVFVLMAGSGPGLGDISWTGSDGLTYDVVKGSLTTLRSTGGDFAAAVTGCLMNDGEGEGTNDPAIPALGSGWFYLVRSGVAFGSPSTYDEGDNQVGLRDAEIAASSFACP